MIDELAGKLAGRRIARRYRLSAEDIRYTASLLRTQGVRVSVSEGEVVPVTGDPEDDLVLATARLAQAEYLVTRDRRLLALGAYEDTPIIDPTAFLMVLARSQA